MIRSLEKSTLMLREEVLSTFDDNATSYDDDVPWAWSDGFSEDDKFEVSSMEFQVTPQKLISLADGELKHQVKESSDRFRSMKQMNGLKVDEKQKRELSMLRSSLSVKSSLLARVKEKKNVDTNEKSSPLDRSVKSVKPIHVGVMPEKGSRTKRIQSSQKPSHFLKTKSPIIKYMSPMLNSGGITGQVSQESSKIVGHDGMSKMVDQKFLNQIAKSQAPNSIVSYASGSNKQVDVLKEKTLHVVEPKLVDVAQKSTEQKHMKLRSQLSSKTLSSIPSSASLSLSYEEDNDESQLTISDACGSKKTQIGEGSDKTPLYPQKSKYKKMLKQTENVKALGRVENFEGETGMNWFRESRESTTIVLRHQDVKEKNTQDLYNDSIEETANKLVETKKSKVKALVSTFESIISLQERSV